jgi:hypothetical protein
MSSQNQNPKSLDLRIPEILWLILLLLFPTALHTQIAAPSSIVIAPAEATNQVALSWSAIPGATSYNVKRGVSPTSALTTLATATDLEFTYKRSRSAVQDGVAFNVEFVESFTTSWSSAGPGEVIADDGTLQTVSASIPAGPDGRRFVRLRISAT